MATRRRSGRYRGSLEQGTSTRDRPPRDTTAGPSGHDDATVPGRPRLRGWIHAAAAPVAAVVAVLLWRETSSGLSRLSIAVFGIALITLYTMSGTYHVPAWPANIRRWLAKIDVAVIPLFIAATYTPVAVHALGGAWRTWSLAIAWTIAVVGAGVALSPAKGPRWLTVAAYVSFSLLAVIPFAQIVQMLPLAGAALILLGGALYILGGVVYARQVPNPWPAWLGFHEVFHLLVVVAGAAHVIAIWRYALPLA